MIVYFNYNNVEVNRDGTYSDKAKGFADISLDEKYFKISVTGIEDDYLQDESENDIKYNNPDWDEDALVVLEKAKRLDEVALNTVTLGLLFNYDSKVFNGNDVAWRGLRESIVRADTGYGFPVEITTKEGEAYSIVDQAAFDLLEDNYYARKQWLMLGDGGVKGENTLNKDIFGQTTLAGLDAISDTRT